MMRVKESLMGEWEQELGQRVKRTETTELRMFFPDMQTDSNLALMISRNGCSQYTGLTDKFCLI